MNPDTLVAQYLQLLREREVQHDAPAVMTMLESAYRQLTQFVRQADRATQDRMLHRLADGLTVTQSNWEFGCLANTCGIVVEHGGDSGIAIEKILDRVTDQFGRVPEFMRIMREHLEVEHPNRVAEDDWPGISNAHPEHAWVVAEWYALRFIGCAAMAMLCRSVAARQRARARVDLMLRAESAAGDNPYAYYVSELLASVDDEPLLVLDVPHRLGFRVRLTAIRNNFHVFTLLQDALLARGADGSSAHSRAGGPPTPRTRPLAVAVAKSERMLPDISPNEWAGVEGDSALWAYYTWLALKPDGSFRTLADGPPAWVWGEMKPTAIPIFGGERIILLGPLETPRSWDIGFFAPLHPALRSSVCIEGLLSVDECNRWLRAIQAQG